MTILLAHSRNSRSEDRMLHEFRAANGTKASHLRGYGLSDDMKPSEEESESV
jgi:hypothetical protein